MAYPYDTTLEDVLPRGMAANEFWIGLEYLPDDVDGKDFKKIIKKIFKKNGQANFDSWEKLTEKLEKHGDNKDHRAFQEWVDAMNIIKTMNAREYTRVRKEQILTKQAERKEQRNQIKSEREARRSAAELVALAAIESASAIELANAEFRRPKPRTGGATSPESVGAEEI